VTFLTGKIATYVTGGLLAIILGLALALTITRGTLHKRTDELHEAQAWQVNVQSVTSHAAGVKGLIALDQVPAQIVYLGQAVSELNSKVAEQNKAIEDMATASAAKIAAGNEALAKVEKDSAAAQKAVSALKASAAGNAGNDGVCVPSKAFLANSGSL
jgi:hypothetical protein